MLPKNAGNESESPGRPRGPPLGATNDRPPFAERLTARGAPARGGGRGRAGGGDAAGGGSGRAGGRERGDTAHARRRRRAASREHQDWHVLIESPAPDRATDRDAVDTREHQVENDEIERARVGTDERGLAVAHGLGLETLEAEVEHDQVTNMRIVFDHQYAGHNQSSLS